jgi:Protein of unknown function (DUF3168)
MSDIPHLVGAIRDHLLESANLVALLGDRIADGQADRDQALPYLVIEVKDAQYLRVLGGKEIAFVTVWLSVFATGRATAESIGASVRDLILPVGDVPAWSPLGIADGWRDVNRQPAGGDSIEIDPEIRAAYGRDVWCCKRPITWTLARG